MQEATRLKVLDLSWCGKLKEVPELPKSGTIEILDLSYFGDFPSSMELNIGNLRNLKLVTLSLHEMSSTQVIKFSSKLRKLTYLTISDLQGLREIEGLSDCRSLKKITLEHCSSLEKLPSLQNLPKLEELTLKYLTSLREIGKNDIADLKCLKNLSLYGCETLERLPIDQLSGLEKLEYLNLQICNELSIDDIFAIKTRLPNVQYSTDNMVGLILKNRVSPY
ncbi:Disease resistance protein L6 [Linum perenne]